MALDRDDFDGHRIQAIAVAELHALLAGRHGVAARLVDGLAQRHQEPLAHHLGKVEGGLTVRVLQEGIRVAAELQDVEALVHDHAGRAVADEEQPVRFPRHIGVRSRPRREERFRRWPLFGRAGDEVEMGRDGGRLAAVDPVLLVQDGEEGRHLADALGGAEHQEPGRRERVVKRREHPFLQPGFQVDQHVPAADEVHARERRVPSEVVAREHAHLADGLADLMAAVHLGEEAPQALRRHVLDDVLEVETRACPLQGALAEVGAEDLDGRIARPPAGRLEQADGDRIRLFTARASGDPDADGGVGGPVLEERGKHVFAESVERLSIAEERSDRDQAVLIQGSGFLGVAFELLRILAQCLDAAYRHAACDAPAQRCLLVAAEVRARLLPQQFQDRGQSLALLPLGV